LRHTERTKVLVHVLDISGSEARDPLEDFRIVNNELKKYSQYLVDRPMVIAANKIDLPEAENNLKLVMEELKDYEIFPISAVTGQGLQPLVYRLADILDEAESDAEVPQVEEEQLRMVRLENKPQFYIKQEDGVFTVSGPEIDKHWTRTNFDNEQAARRFLQIIDSMGVIKALREQGAKDGDVIRIKTLEFDFVD